MIIVDTTVWAGYLRGRRNPETEWLDRELGREEIGLTDLVLSEVLQGLRDEKDFGHSRMGLASLHYFRLAERNWQLRQRETPGESAKKASPSRRRSIA